MTAEAGREALYYPFHLCHERTLKLLLAECTRVHFRDYMALRLSRFFGTTAYADRMGGAFPDLVAAGRLVQGYDVSGPLSSTVAAAVDRDLTDSAWRETFHEALLHDRRFLRGLFDLTHAVRIGDAQVPGPAAYLALTDARRPTVPYTVEEISRRSEDRLAGEAAFAFEYGVALVKTSASLVYTIELASRHSLVAATDSAFHHRLLDRTSERDGIRLANHLVPRTGY